MTRTTIRSMLEATIFTGALAALPVAALAGTAPKGSDATERVPNHAAAEARSTDNTSGAGRDGVPDHAAAEARHARDEVGSSGTETSAGVPDHAAAEARGAADQARE